MVEEARPTAPQPPESFPQTPPKTTRSFDEMNTGTMIFEMQGTLGEVKQAVLALTSLVQQGGTRIDAVERSTSEIKVVLGQIAPKIDDVAGFIKHRGPSLVDKAELIGIKGQLSSEIEKRPTRRVAIFDIAWVVGLIGSAMALGARFLK